MIKLLAIALTVSAIAITSSFADCGGGKCDKKDKDAKKEQAVRTFSF
jgi:hypothetical protein